MENAEKHSDHDEEEDRCLEDEQDAYECGVNILETKTSIILDKIDMFTQKNIQLVKRIGEVKYLIEKEKRRFKEISQPKSMEGRKESEGQKNVQFSDIELTTSPEPDSAEVVEDKNQNFRPNSGMMLQLQSANI